MEELKKPSQQGEVPFPVLVAALQHVSQRQRLAVCALVSTAWRAAAHLATQRVSSRISSSSYGKSLQPWLAAQHSPHITSLVLAGPADNIRMPFVALPLPCTQLRKLCVSNCNIELAPQQPGQAHGPQQQQQQLDTLLGMTGLTQLCLNGCRMASGNGLVGLTQLTSLQHLSVTRAPPIAAHRHTTELQCMRNVLPKLVSLTSLCLGEIAFSTTADPTLGDRPVYTQPDTQPGMGAGVALQHLSCLTALQQLQLALPCTAAALMGLTNLQQLTWLYIEGTKQLKISTTATPGLLQLTGLQRLQIRQCGKLDAAVLDGLQQLRHLEVCNTPLHGGKAGTSSFLSVLRTLEQLTHLYWLDKSHVCAPSPAAYSALAASSKLQELHLHLAKGGNDVNLLIHVLAGATSSRADSSLRVLNLDGGLLRGRGRDQGPLAAMSNLRELGWVSGDEILPMVEFTLPTHLTRLTYRYDVPRGLLARQDWITADIEAMYQGTQLALLRELGIKTKSVSRVPDLRVLTLLTGLHKLSVEVCQTKRHGVLFNQAAKGQPPDVWKQLSDRLNEPTRCWPPVMLQLNKNDLAYWELLGFDRRYLRAEL